MRYFFGLDTPGYDFGLDDGEELPDDKAAHQAALATARELGPSWSKPPARIVVKDETGRIVTEVPLPPIEHN